MNTPPPTTLPRIKSLPGTALAALAILFLSPALLAGEAPPAEKAGQTLTFDEAQTAGIAGFRALWNTPIATAPHGARQVVDPKVKNRGGMAPWAPAQRDGKPAALSFDALQRNLLVRFPGAAKAIAGKLKAGYVIEKVELVLPFADTELWPWGDTTWAPPEGGYYYRSNWGVDKLYRRVRPEWHAVAWGLRKPWEAHEQEGPTWNAYINGAGYWERFGAQGEGDRVDQRFGPTPVNHEQPEGRMDVTASLTGEAFGATPGERLRRLSDCGFLVRKWETYDHRYYTGAYEWATSTGGRAIVIDPPKLVVRLKPGGEPMTDLRLDPPTDVRRLAARLKANGEGGGGGGAPTAVMPSREQLKRLARELSPKRPDWMPARQWEHVTQLLEFAYGRGAVDHPFWFQFVKGYMADRHAKVTGKHAPVKQAPKDGWVIDGPQRMYEVWTDQMLGKQFRGWYGFDAAGELLPAFVYRQGLTGPTRQWFDDYWTAWLMPDRPTAATHKLRMSSTYHEGPLVHPMVDDPRVGDRSTQNPDPIAGRFDSYYAATGDWRGNKSFYRSGFNYAISTTNFNNTASMGALLGGGLIGSEHAIKDGRHGQSAYTLGLWTWADGSTQEELDDYYFGHTIKAQKMVADFAPTHADRMIGDSQLAKSMTMIAEAYHPGLRRYVAGAARTATHHRLGNQEGLYAVLHTLSGEGVYTDVDTLEKTLPYENYTKFGHDLPPDEVARQAVNGPYAPLWLGNLIDDKPLPFQITAAFTQWGAHKKQPLMRRTYLGANYGLYSINAQWGNIPITAHWRREAKTPQTSPQIGTMFARFGVNRTRLVNDAGGFIAPRGNQAVLQHKNKMIIAASPWNRGKWFKPESDVQSVQSSLAFYNDQRPRPTWELYVDGEPVTELPFEAKAGQRITIKDGVTYIGIIPLPSTDLSRREDVVIREGEAQEYYNRYKARAAIVIDNYILQRQQALTAADDWEAIDRAYGGFVVEFGDEAEHGSFEDFQKHLNSASVETAYDAERALHEVQYTSGGDLLANGALTTYQDAQTLDKLFAYQTVSGEPAYLPEGVERDSPFAQQTRTGLAEKNGATLRSNEGQLLFLQHEPVSGATAGYNPLAELKLFSLSTPGGLEVTADGKVSIAGVVHEPKARTLTIDHAFIKDQAQADDAARALVIRGLPEGTKLTFNEQPLERPQQVTLDGEPALVVPLTDPPVDEAALLERIGAVRADLVAP